MTLSELTATWARSWGSEPALLTRDDRLSFDSLHRSACSVAKGLARLRVGHGTRVGILMPNRPEWLISAFAAFQLGAVVVPLNTLLQPRELQQVLLAGEVNLLITVDHFRNHDYLAHLPGPFLKESAGTKPIHDPRLPHLRRVVVLGDADLHGIAFSSLLEADDLSDAWLESQRSASALADLAMIFFTSGTTAAPKAVWHGHASILRAAENVAASLGLTSADRTWGYLPFFFTGGFVAVALATWMRGGAVLLQEIFDAGEALYRMRQHRCTTFFAWPHQAEAILKHPDFRRDALELRKGVGANTAWAPQLYRDDHQAVGTWGMTEAGPMATAGRWDEPLPLRAGSHGRPQLGVEIRIVDCETGAPLAPHAEGEIIVRGDTLMQRYGDRCAAACFDAAGFFHTGDLGWLDERGALHFTARIKDVIKTVGVNVSAAEIEAVVATYSKVKLVHAVGLPDPNRGEIVAIVVVAAEGGCEADELLAFCRAELATYKIPRRIHFCREEELPLLGSGKVDKRRLRSWLEEIASLRS